jgi:integrase
LLVERNGSKLWRQAFRFDGKQKLIALGAYPVVSLADARAGRDANKSLLAKGIDPSVQRKIDRGAARIARSNTFSIVADELIEKFKAEGDDPKTLEKKKWLLGFVSADLGNRPIAEIKAPELLEVLRKIERRGRFDTARRARSLAGRVFKFAIATNRAERDPSADLAGALISPKVQHRAAITEPKAVGALLRAVDDLDGQPTTKSALQLIAVTFVRPGELRHAEWTEFDILNAVWHIPAVKMKMDRPHKVPLSHQAIEIIDRLRPITGSSRYLFPQIRSWHRPISDGTLNAALRRLGYSKTEMTAHGFRSTASTLLNESRKFSGDAIERQLAHQEDDDTRAAYNFAEFWDERVKMMRWWGDYLDELRDRGRVAAIKRA